ncbi:hypothetical protein JCM10213_005449 [Rhodosporidiobolus nylandii]
MHAAQQPRHNPLWASRTPAGGGTDSTAQPASQADNGGRKGSKAKDLSHVPCKFYKANSCTAGKACPFSHELGTPGVTKPICQWFSKGNCRFGHKCALAHVLPGQPLSFDRKNKRLAQQALREAQANGQEGGLVTAANATGQQGQQQIGGGNNLVQTLRQSADLGRAAELASLGYPGFGVSSSGGVANGAGGPPSSSGASHVGDVDAIFGSPDSLGHRTPASSPPVQHRTLPGDAPHSPLSFSTFSHGPTATFIAPTSSGLSDHFGGSNGAHSSFATQAMLSEQARRLSNTSAMGEPLSPPRITALSRARLSFHGASPATDLTAAASPPLAVPGAPAASGTGTIFGTSPFSGSRGLFIPSSYDSNEDGFPRSPPPPRFAALPGELQRQNSNGGWTLQGLAAEEAIEDDGEDDFDEAFLPSSLNDLLTPEEMRRRALRAHNGGSSGSTPGVPSSLSKESSMLSAANSFLNSKSVPADLLLASGKPSFPSPSSFDAPAPARPGLEARSASTTAVPLDWGALGASAEGTNPAAAPYEPPTRSLLSQSRAAASVTSTASTTASPLLSSSVSTLDAAERPYPTATSSLLSATLNGAGGAGPARPPAVYSASFNDAAARAPQFPPYFGGGGADGLLGANGGVLRFPQSGLSPNTNASLAAPGSSLPGGLAAGLSRLHLVPPAHTGETPPSSSASLLTSYAAAAASPPASGLTRSPVPAPGSALARRMSSNSREAGAVGSPLQQTLLAPQPVRRTTGLSEGVLSSGTGAIGEDEEEDGEVIQFDMEVA